MTREDVLKLLQDGTITIGEAKILLDSLSENKNSTVNFDKEKENQNIEVDIEEDEHDKEKSDNAEKQINASLNNLSVLINSTIDKALKGIDVKRTSKGVIIDVETDGVKEGIKDITDNVTKQAEKVQETIKNTFNEIKVEGIKEFHNFKDNFKEFKDILKKSKGSEKTAEKEYDAFDEIIALAPFASSEKIKELALIELAKNDNVNLERVVPLCPFLYENDLIEIIDNIKSQGKLTLDMIVALAPFMDSDSILKSTKGLKVDIKNLASLAPFLDEKTVDEIITECYSKID